MEYARTVQALADRLRRIIAFVVSLQCIVLVILIGTEVFFRYAVGRALSWPEEVLGFVFVWFSLLGVVLLTQSGEHIEFSFLSGRLGPRGGQVLAVFTQVLIAMFSILMIYYGYTYAVMFRFESTPAAGINALWLNISLPVAGLLILFYSHLNIIRIFKNPGRNAG
ncbi:MAG: TRAP transporter small permease [Desulfobacteraceae bacterium]|nr:MAG: TRAP transporter small permease [Desulfobacteraceae bacterium]